MSRKTSNASNITDPVINWFSSSYVSSNLHICDHSIVTFGIIVKCVGFSNASCVDCLHRFRISVLDKVKRERFILQKGYHSK